MGKGRSRQTQEETIAIVQVSNQSPRGEGRSYSPGLLVREKVWGKAGR